MSPRLASIPPVLDPSIAAGIRDLTVLAAYSRARRASRSETTITPRHIVIAACIVMPSIDRINRAAIAHWQEAGTERGQV